MVCLYKGVFLAIVESVRGLGNLVSINKKGMAKAGCGLIWSLVALDDLCTPVLEEDGRIPSSPSYSSKNNFFIFRARALSHGKSVESLLHCASFRASRRRQFETILVIP